MNVITQLWDWVDQRGIVRRVVLFSTLYMTWEAYQWAAMFSATTSRTGMDVAAIIGAVTAPISMLQAAAFKVYSDSRGEK